jgi:hypothetical protein
MFLYYKYYLQIMSNVVWNRKKEEKKLLGRSKPPLLNWAGQIGTETVWSSGTDCPVHPIGGHGTYPLEGSRETQNFFSPQQPPPKSILTLTPASAGAAALICR